MKYIARNIMIVLFFITLFSSGFLPWQGAPHPWVGAAYLVGLSIFNADIILELDKAGL